MKFKTLIVFSFLSTTVISAPSAHAFGPGEAISVAGLTLEGIKFGAEVGKLAAPHIYKGSKIAARKTLKGLQYLKHRGQAYKDAKWDEPINGSGRSYRNLARFQNSQEDLYDEMR